MACDQGPGGGVGFIFRNMQKNIIVAVADNMAIGRDNELLWHISADMKYFRRVTMGCPIIMGYKTWLSIGRPLPGRRNIVITKSHFDAPESVVQVPDVASAFVAAEEVQVNAASAQEIQATAAQCSAGQCFIVGGAKTYERTLSQADKLYITHVHTSVPDADAFFPAIDPAVWTLQSETPPETDPENGLQYSFAVYVRK